MLALITLNTPNIYEYAKIASKFNREYAIKNHYGYIEYSNAIDNKREATWSKILALKANLNLYEWLMWIDSDAMIMNHKIKIETFLDNNYIMIIGDDEVSSINAGVFFIRNCQESIDLLDRVYLNKNNHIWCEQQSLLEIIREDKTVKSKIKIVDRHKFNSWYKDYKDGDFILHLPGTTNNDRIKIFSMIEKETYEN
jgi:hypothetical protein